MKVWSVVSVVALACLVIVSVGCAGAEVRGSAGAPEWFDTPPEGCGVGTAMHRGSRSLARKAAVQRARTELAQALRVVVQGMLRDFQEQGEDSGGQFSAEYVSDVSRSIVDQTLVGTRVVSGEMVEGEYYAMVCMDPEAFFDAFEGMKTLSEKAREALRGQAEERFEQLDAQLDRVGRR